MKVLKKGTNNQVKCDCCESLLEFNASDIKKRKKTHPEEIKWNGDYYIICAVCNDEINVTSKISNSTSIKQIIDERDEKLSRIYL